MTLVELLFFLLPLFLSGFFGKVIFRHVGSWGALPGVVLGFGVWALLWALLNRALRRKPTNRDDVTAK
jgi:hypothetical protein